MKKEKIIFFNKNPFDIINRFKAEFESFEVISTNSTVRVETKDTKYYIQNGNFNSKIFPVFQRIKKDILESEIYEAVPETNEFCVNYFSVNPLLLNFNHSFTHCLDINSAYSSTLFNMGFISDEVSDILGKVSKMVRLKSIGMLATQKTKFTYRRGDLINKEDLTDYKLRNIFFFISKLVGECLVKVKDEYNENCLFFWVDGIYFNTNKIDFSKAFSIFDEYNYSVKTENLTDFSSKRLDNFYLVKYYKDAKLKQFMLPHKRSYKDLNLINKYND